jgi:hypothetical protein
LQEILVELYPSTLYPYASVHNAPSPTLIGRWYVVVVYDVEPGVQLPECARTRVL